MLLADESRRCVAVVVGINREALCQVVGSLCGDHFDTNRYLRSVANYESALPTPTPPSKTFPDDMADLL